MSSYEPHFFWNLRPWFAAAGLLVLVLGFTLWGYSRTLTAYKDFDLYIERYESLESGDDEAFSQLRDESLSPKFALQDYGISLAAIGFLVLLASPKDSFLLKSPRSFFVLALISVLLPFFSVGGYVFDIMLSHERAEYPHWADSIGLGLILVPILFTIAFVWSLTHLIVFGGADHPSTSLSLAFSFKTCWWLLLLALNCAVTAILSMSFGRYWLALPNLFWMYYYLSLGAVYRVEYGTPTVSQNKP